MKRRILDIICCPVCKGKIWIYPTADEPNCGYPGPAILRLADLGDEQMTMLIMWRDRDEELAALEMVEDCNDNQ